MNLSDALFLKISCENQKTKISTLQPKSVNESDPVTINGNLKSSQWQNSLKRNRKNNFNTRSVWYDDRDDEQGQSSHLPSGYSLRKASSLDSLLVDKQQSKLKITKDKISAPFDPRKITSYWNTDIEKKIGLIPEEKSVGNSEDSDSNSSSSSERNEDNFTENDVKLITDIKDENQEKFVGFSLRKATSLDSLVQIKQNKAKISKDKISGPLFPRKIANYWNTDVEKRIDLILEENYSDSSEESDCDNSESDGENSLSNSPEEIEEGTVGGEDKTKITAIEDTEAEITEESLKSTTADFIRIEIEGIEKNGQNDTFGKEIDNEIFRKKERNDSSDGNKRKNIMQHTDMSLLTLTDFKNVGDEKINVSDNSIKENKELGATEVGDSSKIVACENKNIDIENFEIPDKNTENEFEIKSKIDIKEKLENENVNESKEKGHTKLKKNKKRKEKNVNIGSNLIKMKFLSKSIDGLLQSSGKAEPEGYQEVLRTLQSNKDEPLSKSVGPFPRTDDHLIVDDVQLRPNRLENRLRQSKTIDCDPRRYRNQDFDVKGCTKIYLPGNDSVKLKKNEFLQYQNNSIIKNSETHSEVLKYGVLLKSVKLTNKREVELRDVNNHVYLLVFDSSKEAKQFIESDKVSSFADSEKSTITKTLLRLLGKRSSREVLEKKGIYQNEPIFGNTLKDIYNAEKGVPKFILKTMELIERPDNITSLGLYRTSGNLATIQKIRLEVDKGNLDILEIYSKDPDVLTGSLKLFFRELKEPLMSCKTCDNLLEFTKNDQSYCKKDRENIRTILSHIPESNAETLLALIRHLIEVVKYKDQNKMDTYNLAVCWGPTVIFATDDSLCTKDLVTQSTEATKLFDALLNFYINNPDELDFRKKKKPDYLDSNRNMIHRQDSKDSIQSSDSTHSSSKTKSSSNLSLDAIDEVLKKSVDLIEGHLDREAIYKKPGSPERVHKILKKMHKRKLSEMDKYRHDVYDLTDSLKKYLKEGCESLVTKEIVEHVNKICDNAHWLEHNTRQRVMTIISDIPKKDTLIFLVHHLIRLMKYESSHNVSKAEMLAIWSKVLNDQMKIVDSDEKMTNFLRILLDVFDESKSDVSVSTMPKGMSNGLLNDLKNLQKEKDRISKYDNVPDESDFSSKEATIFEEKTEESEQTKL